MTECWGQRGLTLLEMLITLVIATMVATLMSEGLFQLGQIERRLGTGQLEARMESLHELWLQQSLEGLRAGIPGTPDEARGGPRRLQGVSSLLPLVEPAGPMPFALVMTYNASTNQTELVMEVGSAEKRVQTAVLARWSGDTGHFSYMDQSGAWMREWSSSQLPNTPLLPKAIAVHCAADSALVVAAMQASAQSLGKRVEIEKLP
ncbi:MAG: PulJ/GspJ family protein [Roseateles sp.]|uniref:PulJ/GspJ family protein n=1 Tax=Roseateles sp. TaxID=1971397 RepID=UPI004035758E